MIAPNAPQEPSEAQLGQAAEQAKPGNKDFLERLTELARVRMFRRTFLRMVQLNTRSPSKKEFEEVHAAQKQIAFSDMRMDKAVEQTLEAAYGIQL